MARAEPGDQTNRLVCTSWDRGDSNRPTPHKPRALSRVVAKPVAGRVASMRADPFRALADPTRRALLERLYHDEAAPVAFVAVGFPVTRSAISRHLRLLSQAGLVHARPAGRHRFYDIRLSGFRVVLEWMEKFVVLAKGSRGG